MRRPLPQCSWVARLSATAIRRQPPFPLSCPASANGRRCCPVDILQKQEDLVDPRDRRMCLRVASKAYESFSRSAGS